MTWRCEYCGEAAAALHCRADDARLCVACDRHVHAANPLSRRHPRSPLCSSCHARPAASRLAAGDGAGHATFLCSCCLDGVSGGVPIEAFSGCPAAAELAASWGIDLAGGGGVRDGDGLEEGFDPGTLPYTSMPAPPTASSGDVGDGKHFTEGNELVWQQTALSNPACQVWDFNLGKSRDQDEHSALQLHFGSKDGGFMIKSYNEMIEEVSSSSRKDLQYVYDSTYSFGTEDIVSANIYHLTPKQHIRYESRKMRADTRRRVKGRFVKSTDILNVSGGDGG
uniref:B box-type domain-containing protein n=1 Tax=Leersia perrieri TaxID=77586 RepID=A0A0D9XFH8_9ORYZ